MMNQMQEISPHPKIFTSL